MQYLDSITGEFVNIPFPRNQTLGSFSRIPPSSEDAVSVDMESGKIFISVSDLVRQGINQGAALGIAKALLKERIKDYKEKMGMPEIVIDLGGTPGNLDVQDLKSQSFLNEIANQTGVSVKAEECTIFHGENTKSTKGVYFTRVQDKERAAAIDSFFKQNPFGF